MKLIKSFFGKHGSVKLMMEHEQFYIEIIDAIYGKQFIRDFGCDQISAWKVFKNSEAWAKNLDTILNDIDMQFRQM